MTTTAKIFIILVCLFAFIFTPLAIQFAAQTNNWKQLAESWRDQSEADAAYARSVQSLYTRDAVRAAAQQQQDQARITELSHQIEQLNQQIAKVTSDFNTLNLEYAKLKTANELQNGTMAVLAKHHDEMTETNQKLRERELTLQTRNAELLDQVKRLTADKVVLTQQLNQRAQEVAVCREENEALRQGAGLTRRGEFETGGSVAPSARAVNASEAPRAPVRGLVKNVQGNLATIDVGSSSGIREGMVMVVMRGSDYVGDLVITQEVNPTEAVGEVRAGIQNQRIRPGDVVVDEVSFNARG